MQRSLEKSFIYLILILSGHILRSIECSCRISMAELVKNDEGVESCVYIDKAGKRVEVNVNSTHRHTTDCEDCSCIQSGFLTCCGCCFNFYRSPDGNCLACPLGTYGKNCTEECVKGFYGRLCRSQCNCPAESCDLRHGCPKTNTECPLGYHGINCTEKCLKGFYGRLCQSECNCPAEKCDPINGCQKTNTAEGSESESKWVNVTYALIGSVTTMSLIGLLFYLKSWFSKTNVPSTVTDQIYTAQTENQEEQGYESRRNSSSSETESVPQRTQNHPDLNNYTDLRFSRMQPLYDNSKDHENVPEPEAPSVDSIPSQRTINDHNEEVKIDDIDADCEGEYEGCFKHEEYNVLTLRKPFIEKTMALGSVDSLTKLDDNADEMEDGYDSMEMYEKNKEECTLEIRKIKSDLAEKDVCRKSLIDETIQEYIESAQLNRKLEMIVDNETSALMSISKSKSFTAWEFDRPKRFSSRPYSLANSIWRKQHTSGKSKLSRISDYEEVSPLQADDENDVDEPKCLDISIQSNTASFTDQMIATLSNENENKMSQKSSVSKEDECQHAYEEIDSFNDESHKYTKGKNESFEPDTSYEYSQVQKRPQLRFNDSSTLSVELLSEEGEITTKM